MTRAIRVLLWLSVAVLGALALGTIALHRGEQINAMWLVLAAFCTYALGYRFYSKFISAKLLALDARRATPAERLEDGRDFLPTNKWGGRKSRPSSSRSAGVARRASRASNLAEINLL